MGCSCVTLVQSAVRRALWSLWGPPPFPCELFLSSILLYLLEFCCLCWATYLAGPDLDPLTLFWDLNADLRHRYRHGWQSPERASSWLLFLTSSALLAQVLWGCALWQWEAACAYLVTLSSGLSACPAAPWHCLSTVCSCGSPWGSFVMQINKYLFHFYLWC